MAEKSDKNVDEEQMQIRRSFRLKNKPTPVYDYAKYLRAAISHLEKTPAPPSNEELKANRTVRLVVQDLVGKVVEKEEKCKKPQQATRIFDRIKELEKLEKISKKYNDIFDAVFANANIMSTPKRTNVSVCEDSEDDRDLIVENHLKREFEKENDDDEDDIVIEKVYKKPKTMYNCSCGDSYDDHMECHKHLCTEHDDNDTNNFCQHCDINAAGVQRNHTCVACGEFAINLIDHLGSHYRSSTSRTAVMECRFCVKQFMTISQVVQHEQQKHLTKTTKRSGWMSKCNECRQVITIQEKLLAHYDMHLDLNNLWKEIIILQLRIGAEKEECPFCRCIVISRKGLKMHILRAHYPACKGLLSTTTTIQNSADVEVKQEILDMVEDVQTIQEIKQEVKEEVIDEEYPEL